MKRLLTPGVAILLLVVPALAGELTEEEARREAHRTILRRLSETEKAATAAIGLPEASTAFLDLYLDIERNRRAVRERRAPRSPHFFGTAHQELAFRGDRVVLAGCFANLRIDEVSVPHSELPGILAAALDEGRLKKAAIASDGAAFSRYRVSLLGDLLSLGDDFEAALGEARAGWEKGRAKAAATLFRALDEVPPGDWFPLLRVLSGSGGDEMALALLGKADHMPPGSPPYARGMVVRAVLDMDCPVARKHARKLLASSDVSEVVMALGALVRDPDEEVLARMEAILAKGSTAPAQLRSAAISGFETVGTDRARAALEALFDRPASDREKYSVACAITRMGSERAVPWLKERLAEMEARGERSSPPANILRKLLEGR